MNHFTSAHQNWTRKDQKISPQFSLYVAFKIQPLLFRLWLYEASADMELCAHRDTGVYWGTTSSFFPIWL